MKIHLTLPFLNLNSLSTKNYTKFRFPDDVSIMFLQTDWYRVEASDIDVNQIGWRTNLEIENWISKEIK